jgi:(E)-4-hydroxy-3-methylbut-2-enyl-diphosphate synthase
MDDKMLKNTKIIKIGNIFLGGNSPIIVQSMTNTDTKNVAKTVEQIKNLERAGCELVRCSVPDEKSAIALQEIKKNINIPLVADIHFDYKLALLAIQNGADKIRINPGNMKKEHLKQVIDSALEKDIAIRVGVNSGSLKTEECHSPEQKAKFMVDKALEYIDYFEANGFRKIVISLKSSDVKTSLSAYKLFNQKSDYPLHLGITESGSLFGGTIKSSVGLALILNEGLGDTIRVSLSADPVWEIYSAYNILASFGLRQKYPNIISCPTCARTTIEVIELVKEVEDIIYSLDWSGDKHLPITIAVMGCIVNGPGEAKEADFGVCGAGEKVAIFEKGEIVKTVEREKLREEFFGCLNKYLKK